jgi:hypothetical protein
MSWSQLPDWIWTYWRALHRLYCEYQTAAVYASAVPYSPFLAGFCVEDMPQGVNRPQTTHATPQVVHFVPHTMSLPLGINIVVLNGQQITCN